MYMKLLAVILSRVISGEYISFINWFTEGNLILLYTSTVLEFVTINIANVIFKKSVNF